MSSADGAGLVQQPIQFKEDAVNHHLSYRAAATRIEDLQREAARHRIAAHAARAHRSTRVRRARLLMLGVGVRPAERIA
jgi:hypothetical protein